MSRDEHAVPSRRLPLNQVERELALLPRRHSADTGAEGPQPVVRAGTLNLVAVLTDRRKAKTMPEVAAVVSRRYPARVITVLLQPRGAPAGLSSRVSGRCRLTPAGQRQICTEMIDLRARGHPTEHLPSAVASLLASDLPVCLWWRGPLPPAGGLLENLAWQADFLLTEAAEATSPRAALGWLAAFASRHGDRPALAETAWFLLEPWREQVARAFDRPLRGFTWADLDAVRVSHTGRAPSAAALLLGGWVACRLGWEGGPGLLRDDAPVREMTSRGRVSRLFFAPSPARGGPGGIVSVRLSAGKLPPVVVRCRREAAAPCTGIPRPPSGKRLRAGLAAPPPPEEIICRILGRAGPDRSLLRTLAFLRETPA